MDAETLDGLLIDRALQALPSETEALLSAYLARDPDAARRAEEYSSAMVLARRALGPEVTAQLPTIPFERLGRTRRRLVWLRKVASLAACLLLGVAAGTWMGGSSEGEPVGGTPRPAARVAAERATTSSDGFWSLERSYERARLRRPSGPPRLEWESFRRLPKLGDAT